MSISFESPQPALSAVQRWIDSATGKPIVSRYSDHNLETRTVAAVELLREGFYSSAVKASKAWAVPYKRLLSRQKGKHPVPQNGGNFTLFSPEEEKAILAWCWRRVTQGHHIQMRTLRQYANSVLKAIDRPPTASRFWARRFLRRYSSILHRKKSSTLAAQRKAMADRANVEEWFHKWHQYTEKGIDYEDVWNIDKTGFQIGYLKNGIFLWTFNIIKKPILTDAHETISVTIIESISAKGRPLDVGLFCVYKHWHQEILLREIADGATDFNKADFLFYLQEVHTRTTKRSTIISSWQKTGIYPFDPEVVLARMINPLSSLSLEVAEESLPGYISRGSSSTHSSDNNSEMSEEGDVTPPRELHHSNRRDQEIRLMSTPPPRLNWIEMNTPQLKMRQIRQYEEYVALRIECSIASGTPLTPSVSHVNEKVRKAHTTLAVNGITATQEMRRLKEKNLKRSARDQGTTILANYGPITIYDARLRVAKDQHNRLAGQAAEEACLHTKEVRDEVRVKIPASLQASY
ncbi:hypothetical protein F53441_9138 [Fusarium austroafricanum]|uniref:HTH CENPB-type domain-containing protein n=1 Tax=Fusarium austroafricanum TaxID=2364996 RepID=A0A8H4NQG3_9HYPO|nr:hypothetical protein F53441_9138 [Fusarium austroafricanum]